MLNEDVFYISVRGLYDALLDKRRVWHAFHSLFPPPHLHNAVDGAKIILVRYL